MSVISMTGSSCFSLVHTEFTVAHDAEKERREESISSLEELAARVDMPVLVTQVGVSTSPIEPKHWVPGFGGHRVEDVPETYRSVWRDIRTAKGHETFAGLVFFELHDEWWKSGEDRTDPHRHEPEDPEEWFGIYAIGKDNRLVPKGEIPSTVRGLFSAPGTAEVGTGPRKSR